MVCLGNICRSPVAEGVLRKVAADNGLNIKIDSAGTSNYHIGANPDSRSVKNARKNGVDISKLIARQFKVSDFEEFDRIYVMDKSNLYNVLKLADTDERRAKIKLIMDELYPGKGIEVPDPYYGYEDGFQKVFDMLNLACNKIVADLKENA